MGSMRRARRGRASSVKCRVFCRHRCWGCCVARAVTGVEAGPWRAVATERARGCAMIVTGDPCGGPARPAGRLCERAEAGGGQRCAFGLSRACAHARPAAAIREPRIQCAAWVAVAEVRGVHVQPSLCTNLRGGGGTYYKGPLGTRRVAAGHGRSATVQNAVVGHGRGASPLGAAPSPRGPAQYPQHWVGMSAGTGGLRATLMFSEPTTMNSRAEACLGVRTGRNR